MYWKYAPYLFLALAAFALYDAIMRMNEGRDPLISFLFAGLAIAYFFFKRNFYKKRFDNRK
ncbi:hypothetical protein HYN59_07315 [Flavobacterium album]|uniref:Uncharacterized protein n=1 Tax=Flavobacterium album TaxID=2175091 RepID=A0A2S1R2S2_9FLAO|nr:hypothetical protein HYN59_07315 [Flavobacterium album]